MFPRARQIALTIAALAVTSASGCASYVGTARGFSPAALDADRGWIAVRGVPVLKQQAETDCGAAALGMVISHLTGIPGSRIADQLRPAPKNGHTAGRLRATAQQHGLAAFLLQGEVRDLRHELSRGRPVLVGLVKPHRRRVLTHYEVVVAVHPARRLVVTLDPAEGWRQNTLDGFLAEWKAAANLTLIVAARQASKQSVSER